jgi:hypothetical protein
MIRSGAIRGTLLVVVVLAIGACSASQAPAPGGGSNGGGSTPQATAGGGSSAGAGATDYGVPAKPDPCTIVTADEFKAKFGWAVKPGRLDPFSTAGGLALPQRAYCTFYPQDASVFNDATIVIDYNNTARQSDYDTARTQPDASPVSGIGDKAFQIVHEAGNDSTVHFFKGGWYVELNAGGSAWAPTADQLTAIAKLIASRLP